MTYYLIDRSTGKLLSRHKTDDARYKARRKDVYNMMELDSDEVLTPGEFYPEIRDRLVTEAVQDSHISFTMDYLKAQASGEQFLAAAFNFKLHGADPAEVVKKYSEVAQQRVGQGGHERGAESVQSDRKRKNHGRRQINAALEHLVAQKILGGYLRVV